MSETAAAEVRTYTYEELAGHDVYEVAHSGWTGAVSYTQLREHETHGYLV